MTLCDHCGDKIAGNSGMIQNPDLKQALLAHGRNDVCRKCSEELQRAWARITERLRTDFETQRRAKFASQMNLAGSPMSTNETEGQPATGDPAV